MKAVANFFGSYNNLTHYQKVALSAVTYALIILFGLVTKAETICIVNGKIDACGAGERALIKDPTAKVYKIQANQVGYNEKTGNLKKSDDVSPETLKNLFKSL